MMTEDQLIEKFIQLHDNPDSVTEEQMCQLLADNPMHELVRQMAFAKRVLKSGNEQMKEPDVDREWAAFSATHSAELDALDEDKSTPSKAHSLFSSFRYKKVAAIFIGVLLFTGLSFAAVHIIRYMMQSPKATETSVNDKAKNYLDEKSLYKITDEDSDSLAVLVHKDSAITDDGSISNNVTVQQLITDTIPSEPYIFNNVELENILVEMSKSYNVQVVFKNEQVRKLRFHFLWNPEESLEKVVEKLNNFESVEIVVENEKLLVR